jgi:hypothetical protein
MRRLWIVNLLTLWMLAGCQQESAFVLSIVFPSEELRNNTRLLNAQAISPQKDSVGCTDLLYDTVDSETWSSCFRSEAQEIFNLSGYKDSSTGLEFATTGRVLFFIQGTNTQGQTILRGCTETVTGPKTEHRVTVNLLPMVPCVINTDCDDDGLYCTGAELCSSRNVCVSEGRDCNDDNPCTTDVCNEEYGTCQNLMLEEAPRTEGPLEDPTCSDGIDNDCNGLTDDEDPSCKICEIDGDCDDFNFCTRNDCLNQRCVNEGANEGQECGKRMCLGTKLFKFQCHTGRCTQQTEVTNCADNNDCTTDKCLPLPNPHCENLNVEDGKTCSDKDACTIGDQCTGGTCISGARMTCKENEICTNGVCHCRNTNDTCEPGQFCNSATGTCLPCDQPLHCGPNCLPCTNLGKTKCINQKCGCIEKSDCPEGQYCNASDNACHDCVVPEHCGLSGSNECRNCLIGTDNKTCIPNGLADYVCGCTEGSHCDRVDACATEAYCQSIPPPCTVNCCNGVCN